MFDETNVDGHALTLELDDFTEKVLIACWAYNGSERPDPDVDLREAYAKTRPYLELTHKQARILHTSLGLLVRVPKVEDAEEDTSEWLFGRLSDHGPAKVVLFQLHDWAPRFDAIGAALRR